MQVDVDHDGVPLQDTVYVAHERLREVLADDAEAVAVADAALATRQVAVRCARGVPWACPLVGV